MLFDGTYEVEAKTPIGVLPMKITFKQNGDALIATIDDGKDVYDSEEGTITGSEFSAKCDIPNPMGIGSVKAQITGKFEDNTVSGRVKLPFGMAKFSGVKL